MQSPDLAYAIGLPPSDAVAYLESLHLVPTRRWHDIWQESRAKALTVAGMTRLDLLGDVRSALVDAVKTGKTGKQFSDALIPILRAKGWTGKRESVNPKTGEVTEKGPDLPARCALIYRQNVQVAYMAARYQQMLANVSERPWWMYIAVLDGRTRPHHAALHRKVFRYDDPFWKTHYVPNGFGCRCRVRALSNAQMEREGLTPESEGRMVSRNVVINPRAPEEERIVREVWGWQEKPGAPIHWTDPGFSWNPGEVWLHDECAGLPSPPQAQGATNWKTLGLPSLRDVPAAGRLPAPALLPAADSREGAEKQIAEALGFSGQAAFVLVATPVGERVIHRDLLPHMVEKRNDARERYAAYILPTLREPYEIWLKEHEDGKLRENYINIFQESEYGILVVVRINRDGSLVWNIMHRNIKKMDGWREGLLVWQKKS